MMFGAYGFVGRYVSSRTIERYVNFLRIELLKNSIVSINKTASIVHFNETETNGELIFQQLW